MAWAVEYTDTFGGEANYAWVRRAVIPSIAGESQRSLMRRAKAAVAVTGLRGRTGAFGDGYMFRPHRVCTVLFVTWADEDDENADVTCDDCDCGGDDCRGEG